MRESNDYQFLYEITNVFHINGKRYFIETKKTETPAEPKIKPFLKIIHDNLEWVMNIYGSEKSLQDKCLIAEDLSFEKFKGDESTVKKLYDFFIESEKEFNNFKKNQTARVKNELEIIASAGLNNIESLDNKLRFIRAAKKSNWGSFELPKWKVECFKHYLSLGEAYRIFFQKIKKNFFDGIITNEDADEYADDHNYDYDYLSIEEYVSGDRDKSCPTNIYVKVIEEGYLLYYKCKEYNTIKNGRYFLRDLKGEECEISKEDFFNFIKE